MGSHRRKLGKLTLLLGLALLAALLMPAERWPLCLALLLIGAGISLLRR